MGSSVVFSNDGKTVTISKERYDKLVSESSVNNAVIMKMKREKKTSRITIDISVKKIDEKGKILDVSGSMIVDSDGSGNIYKEVIGSACKKINDYAAQISSEYNNKFLELEKGLRESNLEIEGYNSKNRKMKKNIFIISVLLILSFICNIVFIM